jgi:ribosomal protein S14
MPSPNDSLFSDADSAYCCDGSCVDIGEDPNNCGQCGDARRRGLLRMRGFPDLDHRSLLHTGKLLGTLRANWRFDQQWLLSDSKRDPARVRLHQTCLLQRSRRSVRHKCRLLRRQPLRHWGNGKVRLALRRGELPTPLRRG